jgi:ribonuclease E
MSKRILIDTSNTTETRVAVTQNGKLDDYEIETGEKNTVKGDVYLAKITRVEPSLQAAFVDFGAKRNGFLSLTEIHPDYFKIPVNDQEKLRKLFENLQSNGDEEINNESELDKKNDKLEDFVENSNEKKLINSKEAKKQYVNFFRKYKIQDVIKPRQVILVQINKEERALKGAALTTFLSFAGRYCVLMPNSLNKDGISRKIADVEERKKLKAIISSVNIPENMSVIIRTAGIGKTKKEIAKDLSFLTAQWNKIRQVTLKSEAPTKIYEEGNIIKRTIRDMLTEDVNEVLIDGKNGYDLAKKITKNIVPSKVKNIKLFKVKDKSLFIENNIETQINELFSVTVKLESGGSIVINTTEALVAIDVNSGKNTSERNIESTALKTNLEAATEVARQLRLRDLGGLVVIDFIDMDDYRNNFKVEKTIKNALYIDRARVQVGRISMFGLLELSRQRLRSSIVDRSFEKCPYCNGSGIILNTNSISEQIIKVIKEKIIKEKNMQIEVKCNSALAETLINKKRLEINQLELLYKCKILFIFDNHFSLHEPLININEQKSENIKSKKEPSSNKSTTKKKSVKKKTILKKKEIKIKPRKKKLKIEKLDESSDKNNHVEIQENLSNQNLSKEIIIEDKDMEKQIFSETNEKSGWWKK